MVDWQSHVLGTLWTLRENVVFTYHTHLNYEKELRQETPIELISPETLKKAEEYKTWGDKWHTLYDDMTALRDKVGVNPNAMTLQEFEASVERFTQRKKSLDQDSVRTNAEAYKNTCADLNGWWYKSEAQAHKRYGWDVNRVPSE